MRTNHFTQLATMMLVGAALVSPNALIAAPVTGGTGPGGIGLTNGTSSLRLWLRGDTLGAVSSNIAAWTDSSGSGYTVTQGSTAPQVFQTGAFNGQKAATFDAPLYPNAKLNNGTILGAEFAAQNATMFTVYKNDTYPANDHFAITTTGPASNGGSVDLYQSVNSYNGDFRNTRLNGVGTGYPSTGSHIKTVISTSADNSWKLRADGSQLHSTSQAWGVNTTFTIGQDTTHGAGFFNGEVAEIAIFNTALNSAQVQIVENAQSSRYNIGGIGGTDKSLATNDHYRGDTTPQGNFDFDVVGIGRVDAANEVTSGGSGGFGIEAVGTLSDNTWALAGHDNGLNGVTTADMPGGVQRWERSWFIDTDNITNANLAFNWIDANNTATFDPSFLGLYFRPNNSGTFSLVAVGSVNTFSERVDFLNVPLNLADGYFTIGAIPTPEPSTLSLLGLGAIGIGIRTRRRRTA